MPAGARLDDAAALLERCAAELGLTVALRTTHRTRPGSQHWHLRQGRGAGTLEATLWPERGRLWLTVRERRDAPWVAPAAELLGRALASALADCADKGARV